MDDDRRRAGLVGCTAVAILLTAALMPAAGLGSFPDVGGSPAGDAGGTGAAEEPIVSSDRTARSVTPSGGQSERPTTTPTETTESAATPAQNDQEATATTPEAQTTTAASQSDGGQGWADALAGLAGLLEAVLGSLAVLFAGVVMTGVLYLVTVLIAGIVYGTSAVARLPFGERIQSIPQATMASLIDISGSTTATLDRLRAVVSSLAIEVRLDRPDIGALLQAPVTAVGAIGAGIGGLAGALGDLTLGGLGGSSASTTPEEDARGPTTATPGDSPPDETEQEQPQTVANAFAWLVAMVPVANSQTATPAEIARAAVSSGLPEAPVRRLTELFRDVRYGGYDETTDRIDSAYDAVESLRGALGCDDD